MYFANVWCLSRYAIDGDAPTWQDAEKQVRNAAKHGKANPVVSVKSTHKRKAGQTAAEIYEAELGKSSSKKVKKGKQSH